PAGPLGRDGDLAPVPHRRHKVGVVDARKFRLRAERHRDRAGQLVLDQAALQAAVAAVDLELPFAIQAQPIWPSELRARVFGAGEGEGWLLCWYRTYASLRV